MTNTSDQKDPTLLNLRTLHRFIKRIDLSSNSAILIKQGSPMARHGNLQALAQVINDATDLRNVIVLVVSDFDELGVANLAQMNELGWFHIDQVRELIPQPQPDPKTEVLDG